MTGALARRVACVTGAASGIGRAVALDLSRQGDAVALLNVGPVEPVAAEIGANGGAFIGYPLQDIPLIANPVPWPNGAKCAVAITFDMDAESLIHLEHPTDGHNRVSALRRRRAAWRYSARSSTRCGSTVACGSACGIRLPPAG